MREPDPFEKMTGRQREEYTEALAKRGRRIQDQANARLMQGKPGKGPKTRGLSPVDTAEAHRNIAARQVGRDAYLQKLRDEEAAKRALMAKEARIKEKVAAYEASLREKAGLSAR